MVRQKVPKPYFQGQLLRFQFEAHGKFTRKRQSEKIAKRLCFLPRLGPADGHWPGKEQRGCQRPSGTGK